MVCVAINVMCAPKNTAKYMLPGIPSGAIAFLSTDVFRWGMNKANSITFDTVSDLPKLLAENTDHRKLVFGVKTVPMYSINFYFFQLMVTGIRESG